MKLTYIFHSGFAVETEACILIFDYWHDPAKVLPNLLLSPKPMYVFSSHFHEDHFTKKIFEWKANKPNVKYILSKDILKRHRADKDDADVWLAKGGTWSDACLNVTATGSNDSGVSWIIDVDGKRIFHAGDLNNWFSRFLSDEEPSTLIHSDEIPFGVDPIAEEKAFLGELKDVRKLTDAFDVAFFPVDGRIGNGYMKGGRQFLDRFKVNMFVPMHFVASGFESSWRFKNYSDRFGVPFWTITENGDTLFI
ncbi:MAG: MBL fold metallo-hydrolase [Paludibacteraceae bacterium]|nr:MBL fold metallo-hydrolase [Paludibacteraceae bacterium]